MKSIFFDLDGTLVDSSEGIHNSFVQTFERLHLPVPDAKTIRTFMGPPLEVTFQEEIGPEKLDLAIAYYREYYKEKGQYQAQLYPGIKDLLEKLQAEKDCKLYITTSKNEPIALQMCQELDITDYFDGIYGSTPAAFHKADVLQRAIDENHADKETSIIVGDTKFDMIGGKTVGVHTLAVTWGFGTDDSLTQENPDYLAHNTTEVFNILKTF